MIDALNAESVMKLVKGKRPASSAKVPHKLLFEDSRGLIVGEIDIAIAEDADAKEFGDLIAEMERPRGAVHVNGYKMTGIRKMVWVFFNVVTG